MLLAQTLDKLEALGLFGMVLGLREQLGFTTDIAFDSSVPNRGHPTVVMPRKAVQPRATPPRLDGALSVRTLASY
jgi:hypothetical protein